MALVVGLASHKKLVAKHTILIVASLL